MLTVEAIARITHEANRAYCAALGDYSQGEWELAYEWQRESAIKGVEAVLSGEAKTPEEQHQAWYDHKLREGWVWGPQKDSIRKTHPCMVHYSQLPPEQQLKDKLFRAIVTALTPVHEGVLPGVPGS